MSNKEIKLTIIGSGTMMPTEKRHPSCYLLEIGGKKILLDIGHTSISRLLDLKVDLHSIDLVFISHFHTDHFADFLPLIHSRWVDDLHQERKHKKLTALGPKSLKNRFEKLREVSWPEPKESYPVKFIEGSQEFSLDKIKIKTFKVHHVKWFESIGIKISINGKTLVYTGDIGSRHPQKDLIELSKNADLLIIEAGYPKPTPNHFTIDQVIDISRKAEVKKTIATHLRDKNVPFLKNKLKEYPSITLAKELKEISL